MKLEDQVVSLELAKKLKELGVKQDGHFFWAEFRNDSASLGDNMNIVHTQLLRIDQVAEYQDYDHIEDLDITVALTVAELGEMLPVAINGTGVFMGGSRWCGYYKSNSEWNQGIEFKAQTEADARAKMLIHLIEKGIVKS
jgi:hypothetical protein